MDSIRAYFEMGGYGIYVWPAFAVAAVVLVGLLFASLRSVRASEETLKKLRGAGKRQAPADEGASDANGDRR
ncbi:MAG: heme exporter protein CcmD [Alphaproteobacteria bacterium]